jgi:cytochrome oxidase Cu insertion factor (SCO1/SenC/PrrC family)
MTRLLLTALGLAVALATTPAADPPPAEKTGIKLGETAPAFKLKDQSGTERELSALLKTGPVALVFYRSASW